MARILASPEFTNASRLRDLLTFVVEETLSGAGPLKETTVALRVFNRRSSFDPSGDSVVRVAAHNLRSRLQAYYLNSGRQDTVVIEVPKGSYAPSFRTVAASPPPSRSRRNTVLLAASVLVVAILVGLIWGVRSRLAPQAPPSLAVLSFADFGDPQTTVLCQGVTEDLTTELARLPKLKVIARTSATQFHPQGGDVREIGTKLGATAVLEGSVRREGNTLRFTSQLIDAHSRYHLWSEAYERSAKDPLAAEAEVVRLIAAAVARRLGAGELPSAASAHVPTAEGFDLYWKARYLRSQKLNADAWLQARNLLQQAVRADPKYAGAWAELATLSVTLAFHGVGSFGEQIATARDAAARAIQLEGNNPDGEFTLAEIEWLQNHNWPAAERRFRRALELTPSFALGHGMFAVALMSRGRFDESLAELDKTVALNPLPYVVSNDRATALYVARRYDQSIARCRQVLAIDPKFWYAHILIGSCLTAQGRYAEAIREYRLTPPEDQASVEGRLGNVLALAGQRPEALTLLRDLRSTTEASDESGDGWVHTAFIQVGLGDKEGALDSLERAYPNHETDLNFIAVEPVFDPLRHEPRFQVMLKKLGF